MNLTLQAQAAALRGTLSMVRIMTGGYIRLMDMNTRPMDPCDPRRMEDWHLRVCPLPGSAELDDHYGRRGHDVDVERI
jgi:hypothetical protein